MHVWARRSGRKNPPVRVTDGSGWKRERMANPSGKVMRGVGRGSDFAVLAETGHSLESKQPTLMVLGIRITGDRGGD
jgi:hypothetical protein